MTSYINTNIKFNIDFKSDKIKVLLGIFLGIYVLLLSYIIYKKFIKPKLETEHYLDYSPFEPLNKGSEATLQQDQYYLYNNIQREMLDLLKKNKIMMSGLNSITKREGYVLKGPVKTLDTRLSGAIADADNVTLPLSTGTPPPGIKGEYIALIIEQLQIIDNIKFKHLEEEEGFNLNEITIPTTFHPLSPNNEPPPLLYKLQQKLDRLTNRGTSATSPPSPMLNILNIQTLKDYLKTLSWTVLKARYNNIIQDPDNKSKSKETIVANMLVEVPHIDECIGYCKK